MSKKIVQLRQKIIKLEEALQKDNLSEKTREAISQRLFDVKTELKLWESQNVNNR